MTIIGWTLYACLSYGSLECHRAEVAQMSYISTKEVCLEAAKIIRSETGWSAHCLPVMREN